jgi:hypothetical protein
MLLSVVIFGALFAAPKIVAAVISRSLHRSSEMYPSELEAMQSILLYFWSNKCGQCTSQERYIRQAQADALNRIGTTFEVLKVDAEKEDRLVRLMHVMTVPTTVLLDAQKKIVAWNPGLTLPGKLLEQYRSVQPGSEQRAGAEIRKGALL